MSVPSSLESDCVAPTIPSRTGIRLSFPSVDDCLGPASGRFFGSGYRRARYRVRDIEFEQSPTELSARGGRLGARGGVAHSASWSSKADSSAPPHLTTLDCLLLGVRSAELCVAEAIGLQHRERLLSWPSRVDVKASGAPYEHGLDDFPVEARLEGAARPGEHTSRVECRVATMRARVDLAHPPAADRRLPRGGPIDDDMLDARYPGPYGRAFHEHRQSIRHLVADLDTATAHAGVTVTTLPTFARVGWFDRPHGRPVSMVDALVVTLQMGQVLLYEADGISRDETDALWMRRTTITSQGPRPPRTEPLPAVVRVHDAEHVRIKGESWRTTVISGTLDGFHTRCAVAHRLPETGA